MCSGACDYTIFITPYNHPPIYTTRLGAMPLRPKTIEGKQSQPAVYQGQRMHASIYQVTYTIHPSKMPEGLDSRLCKRFSDYVRSANNIYLGYL